MVDKKWSQNKFGGQASATVFTLTPILVTRIRSAIKDAETSVLVGKLWGALNCSSTHFSGPIGYDVATRRPTGRPPSRRNQVGRVDPTDRGNPFLQRHRGISDAR